MWAAIWNAHWEVWVPIATVASAIITAVSVVIAAWALRDNKKTNQVQTFWNIFNEIQDFEKEFYSVYAAADHEKLRNWAVPLFNRLEFMAFLLNNNMMPKRHFIDFYRDFFLNTYDSIFKKLATKNEQENPKEFSELKKLIKDLKEI